MKRGPSTTQRLVRAALGSLLVASAALALAPRALAHEGPPYAIVMDRDVEGWSLSIWADPDIGTGTFFLIFEPPEDDSERRPEPIRGVTLYIQPVDQSTPEHRFVGEESSRAEGQRFDVDVEFPVGGFYRVRHVIDASSGPLEIAEQVEATPPGFGRIDLLWYFAPFAAAGFLWFRALVAKRQLAAASASSAERPPPSP